MRKHIHKIIIPFIALFVSSCSLLNVENATSQRSPKTTSSDTVDTSTDTTIKPTSDPTSGPTTSTGITNSDSTSEASTASSSDTSSTSESSSSSTTIGTSSTTSTSTSISSSKTTSSSSSDIYPTSISIPSSKLMEVGDEATLTVTFTPSTTTVRDVGWGSSNSSIVSVNGGEIYANSPGTAVITATAFTKYGFELKSTCTVTVGDGTTVNKTKLKYTYDDYTENNYYLVDNCPLSGSPKLLIVPVWFNDSDTFITNSTNKANVRNDIQKAYTGTNAETGWRSVKTFYEEESLGTMTLNVTVTDWYNTNQSYTYYGDNNNGMERTYYLVDTVVDWYFENNKSDSRSNYDTNHDGYLDGVMLIYAAPDSQTLDSSLGNLWAYCYWLQQSAGTTSDPVPNVYFWASYDFMYSSTTAYTRAGSYYGHGDTNYCNIDAHTFIHEMGHVLGLQDYYDYSDTACPAGGFSMQDYNVGGHDPYSVMAYGWADPYIPTVSTSITINDFQSSHDVILLANHKVDSPFDEYVLLELYTPTGLNKFDSDNSYEGGYPQGSSQPGIRLWHVDARLTNQRSGGWSTSLSSNPNDGLVYHAFSNSYSGDHASYLGSSYYNYNILQLIRNDTSITYTPTDYLSESNLFKKNDTYSQTTFRNQFVKSTLMNDGNALGWSFTINSLSSTSATITLTKV